MHSILTQVTVLLIWITVPLAITPNLKPVWVGNTPTLTNLRLTASITIPLGTPIHIPIIGYPGHQLPIITINKFLLFLILFKIMISVEGVGVALVACFWL